MNIYIYLSLNQLLAQSKDLRLYCAVAVYMVW